MTAVTSDYVHRLMRLERDLTDRLRRGQVGPRPLDFIRTGHHYAYLDARSDARLGLDILALREAILEAILEGGAADDSIMAAKAHGASKPNAKWRTVREEGRE